MRFTALALVLTLGGVAGGQTTKTKPAIRSTTKSSEPDGAKIFAATCLACHQANGEGLEEKYPPLARSEWVAGDPAKVVRIALHGLTGPVEVAGQTFDGAMPGWGATLKDAEIAAVLTYVRSAWGNKAPPITTSSVTTIRALGASRKTPWTASELANVDHK